MKPVSRMHSPDTGVFGRTDGNEEKSSFTVSADDDVGGVAARYRWIDEVLRRIAKDLVQIGLSHLMEIDVAQHIGIERKPLNVNVG